MDDIAGVSTEYNRCESVSLPYYQMYYVSTWTLQSVPISSSSKIESVYS